MNEIKDRTLVIHTNYKNKQKANLTYAVPT